MRTNDLSPFSLAMSLELMFGKGRRLCLRKREIVREEPSPNCHTNPCLLHTHTATGDSLSFVSSIGAVRERDLRPTKSARTAKKTRSGLVNPHNSQQIYGKGHEWINVEQYFYPNLKGIEYIRNSILVSISAEAS